MRKLCSDIFRPFCELYFRQIWKFLMKSCGVYKFKYKLIKLLPYCAMKGWFLRIRVATLALPIGHFSLTIIFRVVS